MTSSSAMIRTAYNKAALTGTAAHEAIVASVAPIGEGLTFEQNEKILKATSLLQQAGALADEAWRLLTEVHDEIVFKGASE